MTDDGRDAGRRPGQRSSPDPKPLRRRTVGLLMVAWTALMLGWFAYIAATAALSTAAVTLAVGGLVGAVWLIGLLMLALFLSTPDD